MHDGVVAAIAPPPVQRLLASHQLQPWRHPLWLSPTVPREATFAAQVTEIVTLSTRPWGTWEMVRCVDAKTSWLPRTRQAPTWAAPPGRPVRVEHAYGRTGALHLLAGFDTRPGKGSATTAERKRQVAWMTFLEQVDRDRVPTITTMHVVLDKVRMPQGTRGQAWRTQPPRFVFHFPPVHGSWMHPVAQWFSLVQRQRLRMADCADKPPLAQRLMAFVAAWHTHAHPLQWSTTSVAKVMAQCESTLASAA